MQHMSGQELDERIHKFLNKKFEKFPTLRLSLYVGGARQFPVKKQPRQEAL